MPCRRPLALAAALVVAALGSRLADPAPAASASSTRRPRLVLFVSVDQMRFDYLTRFASLFTGGLRRILDRGAVFTEARYRHACTETGPGHSVILSGRSPRSSGIVANSWYDRALRRRVNVVDDATVRVLGGAGRTASPTNFIGFTVGDVLKAHSPDSKVVGVSFKDRAAILMAGKRADAAYWYDASEGRFVTSSWYTREAPRWLADWNARRLPDAYASRPWNRLLPDPAVYERLAGPDDVRGEFDNKRTTFPHAIAGAPPSVDYYDDLRRTPFADEILFDFALAAMKAHDLGTDDATDLLAVGFSACDVIGHTYGPDSQEMMDQMLRLDRTLGRLLEEVDRRAGPGRSLVVLTADHGVMPLVERLQAQGLPARRATGADLHGPVMDALHARFPGAARLFAEDEPDPLEYVLDQAALAREGLKRAEVEQTIREALLGTGLVDHVYTAVELMGPAPGGDEFFELHQRAFFAPRSGDLIVRTRPYVYLGGRVGGTGHGTPHEYDRHVPIVFLGPGIAPGRRTVPCGPEDIAWTLGRLLGLDYPQQDAAFDLLPLLSAGSGAQAVGP